MTGNDFEITDNKKYNDKTWWEMRPYMILMTIESWANYKKFFIKACKKNKKLCKKNIAKWERGFGNLSKKIKEEK